MGEMGLGGVISRENVVAMASAIAVAVEYRDDIRERGVMDGWGTKYFSSCRRAWGMGR